MCRGGTRLGNTVDTIQLCKTKTSQETQKSLMKLLEPTRNQKSFTLTIPWNLTSLARTCYELFVHERLIDPRRMVLRKEHCAKWRNVCCIATKQNDFFKRPKKKIDKRKSRKETMIKKSNDEESQKQKRRTNKEKWRRKEEKHTSFNTDNGRVQKIKT